MSETAKRPSDYDPSLQLVVSRTNDGDICMSISAFGPTVTFSPPSTGGGKSVNTWRAAGGLLRAMQNDGIIEKTSPTSDEGSALLRSVAIGITVDSLKTYWLANPHLSLDVIVSECGLIEPGHATGKEARRETSVFAHAKLFAEMLKENGIENALAWGNLPDRQRETLLERFKAGKSEILMNFDAAIASHPTISIPSPPADNKTPEITPSP